MKTGTQIAIGALLLAIASAVTWFVMNARVGIPENRTLFVATWLAAAGLGLFSFFRGINWYGTVPALGAVAIGAFLTFTVSISAQEVADGSIRVGDPLPVFTATIDSGETVDSADLLGKPVLIKFFRAHW